MADSAWYERLFGEDYLRIWGPRLTPERTAREVDGILQRLDLPPGSRLLDLCCGHGRHAIPLAGLGYDITGFDLSQLFLRKAQTDAAAQGVPVRWVRGDMRALPFKTEFDGVLNIYTAFGYFEEESEDLRVLQEVARVLRPGGRFLIETAHRESALRRFTPHQISRTEEGLLVLEERTFDLLTNRVSTRMTVLHPDGGRTLYDFATRCYGLADLHRLLHAAGLTLRDYFGGLDARPLTLDSQRLVVISQK